MTLPFVTYSIPRDYHECDFHWCRDVASRNRPPKSVRRTFAIFLSTSIMSVLELPGKSMISHMGYTFLGCIKARTCHYALLFILNLFNGLPRTPTVKVRGVSASLE